MASRPVYVTKSSAPYYVEIPVEFVWNSGLSKSQKQKNIQAIHGAFHSVFPDKQVLEISSKSLQPAGVPLSAFNLKLNLENPGETATVECCYQSSKVFTQGGPYVELLRGTSREAKKDDRLKTSGALIGFRFQGKDYPTNPTSIFYQYLYINALLDNPDLAAEVLMYDGFTDIEFNPNKGMSSQAAAAAVFVSLCRQGLQDRLRDFDSFLSLFTEGAKQAKTSEKVVASPSPTQPLANEAADSKAELSVHAGMKMKHPKYGEGTVKAVDGQRLTAVFNGVGEKTLGLPWCLSNCKFKE